MVSHADECVCSECFERRQTRNAGAVLEAHGRSVNPADRWLAMYVRSTKMFNRCESPAEEALLAGILMVRPTVHLESQAPIRVGSRKYLLDLAIYHDPQQWLRLDVEVDGHAFHDRTLAQAKADRARDRDLTLAGWRVIRFTASEVFEDAIGCARKVFEILEATR